MSIITLTDKYNDTLVFDTDEGCDIRVTEGDTSAEVWFGGTPEALLPLADAIYEAAGGAKAAPQDAVLASSISLNEALLRVAATHGATVFFRYAKPNGTIESRAFTPGTIKDHGDHKTFTGYDPDRDAVRAFRLDRIKGTVEVSQ